MRWPEARALSIAASEFHTSPSVISSRSRRIPPSPPMPYAAASAASISVPPMSASRPRTKRRARATLAAVAGVSRPNSTRWLLPNATMSKRSPGPKLSRMRSPAIRTCAMESPIIDPEQSTTILTLRRPGSEIASGISGRKLASATQPSSSRATSACDAEAAVERASRTRSRSIAAGRTSAIVVCRPSGVTATSCDGDAQDACRSTPRTATFTLNDGSAPTPYTGSWCGIRPPDAGSP